MDKLPSGGEPRLSGAELIDMNVEIKAMSVVRSIHLLRYPYKYAPWHLVKSDSSRHLGYRIGEWYQSFDALYLDPERPIAEKAAYLTETITYIRNKTEKKQPESLREYIVQHGDMPEGWEGSADYRDEHLQPLAPDDIVPPASVLQRIFEGRYANHEPLLEWLEGVVALPDVFPSIPGSPPDVYIPKAGQTFELLGGIVARDID